MLWRDHALPSISVVAYGIVGTRDQSVALFTISELGKPALNLAFSLLHVVLVMRQDWPGLDRHANMCLTGGEDKQRRTRA